MWNKEGIAELHSRTHESLDILFEHASGVDQEKLRQTLPGFGIPTVWKQMLHIIEVEESWVCDLQDKAWTHRLNENLPEMNLLFEYQREVQGGTQAYLRKLNDVELNSPLMVRPRSWFGELQSPAFILLHVITHSFHHKGQVAAMLRTLGHPAPDTDLQRAT